MKKKQFNTLMLSFFGTLIILGAIVLLVWQVIIPQFRQLPFISGTEIIPFHEHYGLNPLVATLVVDDQRMTDITAPMIELRGGDTFVYIPASFIAENIDPFVFWDDGASTFFISTRYEMLEFTPGSNTFLVNGATHPLAVPIRRALGDVFIPAQLVEDLYPFRIEYLADYNIVTMTSVLEMQTTAAVSVSTAFVHHRPDSRASALTELSLGDIVTIFRTSGDYVFVRTPQGLLGYVQENYLGDTQRFVPGDTIRPTILSAWIDNTTARPPRWNGGKINFVWEASHNQDANALRMQTPTHRSVTVISPTWFDFDMENLRLSSVASQAYVDWAHYQGVQVWPKVFDVNNASARAILMNREARRTVVNQLVTFVDTYNVDGLNIDIEHLNNSREGAYKIQFLRELLVALGNRNVVLSAAVKVPEPFNVITYRHDLIGLTVDFVMVMTYDQHYNPANPGPVASLPWVQNQIIRMLELVPREQLLMGIATYTRVWREDILEVEPMSLQNLSMTATRNLFEENGVAWDAWEWDEHYALYYGYFLNVTIRYRAWRECERSIAAKMAIYRTFDLAGVASWRRMFESPGVWDVLEMYVR